MSDILTITNSMKTYRTELGTRIAALRKAKGFTQQEVAKAIGLTRTSLTQMELGKRDISAYELINLSTVLSFSMDEIIATDNCVREETMLDYNVNKKPSDRISVPALNIEKFRNVLLYMLEKCAGKPNVGETVLYKLLYFVDFNYYELYEEQLTGAEYKRMPYGPVPQRIKSILSSMTRNGDLQQLNTTYHDKPQTRYVPLTKPDLTTLKASEKVVIDSVLEQMSDWNASKISAYSHGDKPWKATEPNKPINYELAFYRTPPYSVRAYDDDESD